jgi:hypothetical protein
MCYLAVALAIFSWAVSAAADASECGDWRWYGGPNHNGMITEAQAVPNGENMKVLWKVRMLGTGHSGPVDLCPSGRTTDLRGLSRAL